MIEMSTNDLIDLSIVWDMNLKLWNLKTNFIDPVISNVSL